MTKREINKREEEILAAIYKLFVGVKNCPNAVYGFPSVFTVSMKH